MKQEDILKKILAKLEEFRHQENMNDASSDVSSMQSDIYDIKNELEEIKKILKSQG